MYYKFSKLAKNIIIINIIMTIIVTGIHGYNIHRINETNEMIFSVMEEKSVLRETAVRYLIRGGEDLFLDKEISTYFGMFVSVLTLFLMYMFAKYNGFFWGFFASITSLFTSLIGGVLMFYLFFSEKSERNGIRERHSFKDEWEEYIHKKSDSTENKV